MAQKVKYGEIDTHSIQMHRGHELYYFTCHSHEGMYFEWQKGARGINLKGHASYQASDAEYFGLDPQEQPTVRNAKRCIVQWINDNR